MDALAPLPSTSSNCSPPANAFVMSSKAAEEKFVPSSLCRPSAFGRTFGLPFGPFVFLLLLLLLCAPLSAIAPFDHFPSDHSDQSHFTPSLSPALSPSPSSVSLVLVAPSADSPPMSPLLPSANFALPVNWNNNRFPYGRTNRHQTQQQKAYGAAGLSHQNFVINGQPTDSVPSTISPLAVWRRHQQTMRAKQLQQYQQQQQQQQQQWLPSQPKSEDNAQPIHGNVGWPNSFSPIANPQQNGVEPNKKSVPSSPFDGVPSFRSQFQQNRRKFTGGGLSRLVLSSEEEEEGGGGGQNTETEQNHSRRNLQQQITQQTAIFTPNANHPTLNNFERYMPLLARHRPPQKNMTATHWSLANSAEELSKSAEERIGQSGGVRAERGEGAAEEEEGTDEAGSDPQLGGGPCVSANCRTWITITIPSELVGLGGAETNGGEAQQKERPPAHKSQIAQSKPPTNGDGRTKPNTVPSPAKPNVSQPTQPSKSRGMPTARGGAAAKNGAGGGTATSTSSPQTNLALTTRQAPPDFVFSTKWILPVNGISVRPNGTFSSSAISSTTPSISTTLPFTIGPRPKVSATQPPAIPRERPSDKVRPPKPWTHTSGKEKASNVPKSRPEQSQQPTPMQPTTDTTIEQAAIWVSDWMRKIKRGSESESGGTGRGSAVGDGTSKASTELIDAIREALAKFRAALSRQGARSRQQQDGPNGEENGERNYEDEQWQTQLKTAWDGLRGTWLEKAVAELAMDAASNGRTEISDGKIAELLQKAGLMDATELDRIKGTKSRK